VGYLSIESVRWHCVFILKMEEPLQTMERLMDFFSARRIYVESLHMQMIAGGEATLLVYLLVEKDRIQHTRHALGKMRGILELQLLENRETNLLQGER
jgi:hypothetical protein